MFNFSNMWQKGFWEFLNFKHDCNFCSDYTVQEHFSSPCLSLWHVYKRDWNRSCMILCRLVNIVSSKHCWVFRKKVCVSASLFFHWMFWLMRYILEVLKSYTLVKSLAFLCQVLVRKKYDIFLYRPSWDLFDKLQNQVFTCKY